MVEVLVVVVVVSKATVVTLVVVVVPEQQRDISMHPRRDLMNSFHLAQPVMM